MPTLIEIQNIEETAELCKKLGLQFIEINMNLPQYQCEDLEDYDKFVKAAGKNHIYYTIHLDENLDVCNFNTDVSSAWIRTVMRTIDVAKVLKIKVLNMHMNPGVYFTLPTEKVYLYQKYEAEYLDKLKQFRELFDTAFASCDTVISIENTGGYTSFQKKGIELLLESNHFALTWDIGHSFKANDIDKEYILSHSDRLVHMHFHDSIGKKDHLTLGTGEIDLLDRYRIAKSCGCRLVLETKTVKALKESVQWLQREKLI